MNNVKAKSTGTAPVGTEECAISGLNKSTPEDSQTTFFSTA
jgi:hypothetical protein